MTREEAAAQQEAIGRDFDLSYWFGTKCKKCCGVYPRFRTSTGYDSRCWYECDVCGMRTEAVQMPWIAEKDWNDGKVLETQLSLF